MIDVISIHNSKAVKEKGKICLRKIAVCGTNKIRVGLDVSYLIPVASISEMVSHYWKV